MNIVDRNNIYQQNDGYSKNHLYGSRWWFKIKLHLRLHSFEVRVYSYCATIQNILHMVAIVFFLSIQYEILHKTFGYVQLIQYSFIYRNIENLKNFTYQSNKFIFRVKLMNLILHLWRYWYENRLYNKYAKYRFPKVLYQSRFPFIKPFIIIDQIDHIIALHFTIFLDLIPINNYIANPQPRSM